jgi:alpha-glucosidase
LNWHKELIHLRRDLPALHEGGMVMLDRTNPNVLSYVRTAPAGAKAVVVVLNMSAQPQTLSLDLAEAGLKGKRVKAILTDESSLKGLSALTNVTLPPFSSWVGSVE